MAGVFLPANLGKGVASEWLVLRLRGDWHAPCMRNARRKKHPQQKNPRPPRKANIVWLPMVAWGGPLAVVRFKSLRYRSFLPVPVAEDKPVLGLTVLVAAICFRRANTIKKDRADGELVWGGEKIKDTKKEGGNKKIKMFAQKESLPPPPSPPPVASPPPPPPPSPPLSLLKKGGGDPPPS